jgi:hypothetical protein
LSQSQRLAFLHSEGARVIRAHPGVYLRLSLKSLFRTVFELGQGYMNHLVAPDDPAWNATSLTVGKGLARQGMILVKAHPWIAAEKAAFAIVMLGLYLLAARGVYCGGMRNACQWLLLGTSLYFLAIAGLGAGGAGSERYRLPVMPAVCIFAAAGVWRPKAVARQ